MKAKKQLHLVRKELVKCNWESYILAQGMIDTFTQLKDYYVEKRLDLLCHSFGKYNQSQILGCYQRL